METLRRNGVPIVLLLASLVSWLFFAFVQLFWLPARKKTFDEFGLSLTPACKTAFQINGILSNEWLLLLMALSALAVIIVVFAVALHHLSRILILCWILLLIAPPVIISGCMILAVETVLIKWQRGLAK